MFKTISEDKGWYLFKIGLGFKSFDDFVFADYTSMLKHKIVPGSYVKIEKIRSSIYETKDKINLGRFMILPFMNSFKDLFSILSKVKVELSSVSKDRIDKDYLAELNESLNYFELLINDPKGLRVTDVYLTDETELLAINEGVMNDFNLSAGDRVLLRNDAPSPVIF